MENKLRPANEDKEDRKTYAEQVDEFRKMPFQFNCLGIGCLGWVIIGVIALVIYFIYRR